MAQGLPHLKPLAPDGGRRHEQVIAAVRAAIDSGRMIPGVRYSVYQLAASLGISRTPVREALLRMEEIGLVSFEARQGFTIALPRAADIADIFAVRIALELPAVRRAATVADPGLISALHTEQQRMRDAVERADNTAFSRHDLRLHDHILEWAGNARARSIINALRETTRLLGASTASRTRTIADIDAEHSPIVDAITARTPGRAEEAMHSHLVHTGRLLVAQALSDESSADIPADSAAVDQIWRAVTD